jgi:serine/threonine protein kinase
MGTKSDFDAAGWELLDNLGGGGQATLYRVKKPGTEGPIYAAKVLKNAGSEQAYERFYREIASIAKIDHPGIINIVGHSDKDANFHFYVMEFDEAARPLKDYIGTDSNPYHRNPTRSLDVYIRILAALVACEAASIVHRDLSPGNILVKPDDTIKLIDFGCCYVEETQGCITLTDEAVGTPHYRAPETEGFKDQQVTISADLYSAAKILWSLVTNRKAFAREQPVFNELSLDKLLPKDPMTWHLHHIFERAVRHDPKNRHTSAKEALSGAHRIKGLIEGCVLPLEELSTNTCPTCGIGKVVSAAQMFRQIDTRVRHPAYEALQHLHNVHHGEDVYGVCPYCGSITIVLEGIRAQSLRSRMELQ